MNEENVVLEGERVTLKTLDASDITNEYINGLNDIDVNRYLVFVRRNIQTRETVAEYIQQNKENLSAFLFGIFAKDDAKPFIGTVHVEMDQYNYSASLGICLFAKRAWKKGYALQSVQLVIDYLFKELGMHYLEAGCYADNKNSEKLFLASGFKESYRVPDKYRHIEDFKKVIMLSLVNDNFDLNLLK